MTTTTPSTVPPRISMALLQQQNAGTSAAVIEFFSNNDNDNDNEKTPFERLAQSEGDLTVARDAEDGEKLQVGIDIAKAKGVIDPHFVPDPYVDIDVLGKSPDQVASEILARVRANQQQDEAAESATATKKQQQGSVIVLVGLSGTGKGTTVAQLVDQLQSTGSSVVTWSNGNLFRSVTLLATTWCDQNCNNSTKNSDSTFDKERALTPENLQSFMAMLSFGKNPDNNNQYDTHIQGLGLDLWVSVVQNTLLKSPAVSKHIPTVAEVTQVRTCKKCCHERTVLLHGGSTAEWMQSIGGVLR